MEPTSPERFAEMIRDAVKQGDEGKLKECVFHFPPYWGEDPSLYEMFPEPVFDTILKLTSDGSLPAMGNSSTLLLLMEQEWESLNEGQKQRLLQHLSRSYGTYADKLAHFVISELLGEYYCNEAAFQTLCHLQTHPDVEARAFVPHGFEHIARAAQDLDLRRRALERLASMKNDTSDEVRNEVQISLDRVEQHRNG